MPCRHYEHICTSTGVAATLDPFPSLLIPRRRPIGGDFCGASSASLCLSSSSCSCWWFLRSCCHCPRRTTVPRPTTLPIPSTRCSATPTGLPLCRWTAQALLSSVLPVTLWNQVEENFIQCVCVFVRVRMCVGHWNWSHSCGSVIIRHRAQKDEAQRSFSGIYRCWISLKSSVSG